MNPPECRGEFAIAVAKGVGMAEGDTEAPPGEPHARSIVDAPMHKATAPRTSIQFRGSEGAWMEYGWSMDSNRHRGRTGPGTHWWAAVDSNRHHASAGRCGKFGAHSQTR